MREGAAAILASRHRRDVPAVKTDEQEVPGNPVAALPQGDPHPAMIDRNRDRHPVTDAPGRAQSLLDLVAVGTDRLPSAVDDHLRRVDCREAQKVGIAVLPPRGIGAGERVLPAEPVPVIDMERQRQHVTAVSRGENGGRTLSHVDVVRSIEEIGQFDGGRRTFEVPIRSPSDRVAAILQGRDGRVLGVAVGDAGAR
jgi:hypothetical protein